MNYLKGITLVIMILCALSALVPMASAEQDSLKVILICQESEIKAGDNITLEVRVYDAGVLVDADQVDVILRINWAYGDTQDIEMEHVSTGKYQGNYGVANDDYRLEFTASCKSGSDSDIDVLTMYIRDEQFQLGIHFTHQSVAYLWPKDIVRATLVAKYRGEYVDVDEFTYLRLVDSQETVTDLESVRKSKGIYEVVVTIEEITENMQYTLQANALYANAHASAQAQIVVNVLTVWYHLETIAGSTATFSLGVADERGRGVSEAEVNIEYPQELTEITDEKGLALFSLTGIHNGATVRGNVVSGELIQSFEGNIVWEEDEEESPSHSGFDVIYAGDDYIYSAGSKITRSYTAYSDAIPLSDQPIHYYITLKDSDFYPIYDEYSGGGESNLQTTRVIKAGSATTNQLGLFSISFSAPQSQGLVYVNFETGLPREHQQDYDRDDDLVYVEAYDGMFVSKGDLWESKEINIGSEPLVIGGKTKITVITSDELADDDMLIAMWMAGKPEDAQGIFDAQSLWSCWVSGGNMIFLEETEDSSKFEGSCVIPSFMSDDEQYTIVAGNMDSDTGYLSINHATLKEGESAGSQNMEILVLILLGGAVLVILTILAFGAFTDNKNLQDSNMPPSQNSAGEGGFSSSSEKPDHDQTVLGPETSRLSQLPMVNLDYPDNTKVSPEEQLPKAQNAEEGAEK